MNYPIFLDIEGRDCLVVGGGKTAYRKIKRLLKCGAQVELVSLTVMPEITGILPADKISSRAYQKNDVQDKLLVIAATDQGQLNKKIYNDAHRAKALVNVVDQPDLCDFIMPALVQRGQLQIAVSSGGNSPALAKKLRQELEGKYDPNYGDLVDLMGEIRTLIKDNVVEQKVRREIFHKLADLVHIKEEDNHET